MRPVKSILSIVILFSFLMVNLSKSIILVNYEMNKKELTEKYCINKDKPEMHCCAKCLLKRKLAQQEEEQKLPSFPDIKTDIQLYCSDSFSFLKYPENTKLIFGSSNLSLQSLFEGTSVFHPPSC